ncbi:hypothetical protein DOTSEDRAFT_84047 [Dothistroma septosporum NZE10]|uniref:F-box domain-containing protein n=1 Tax=Dothistroma septosporum (strain NZE10 / CBS 128990) TaxID=675120 RepID=N1Q192_DOTSN|nr:hypothetical protein DOTSEDRAFT_84047 [Dothistroma septosporum NZE10]
MDSSLFLRLSPELRNVVYEHTFTSQYAVTLLSGKVQHSLTMTCRQLRRETLKMYYSIARLNAHLDDGPATPLAEWLKVQGPELIMCINELNIWDMHNLNGTLHGTDSTTILLRSTPAEGMLYTLRPVGAWVFNRGWYLKDIMLALHGMGLSLSRFCIVNEDDGDSKIKQTSEFAIVPLEPAPVDLAITDDFTGVNEAARQFGLSDRARGEMITKVASGERTVRLVEGHRRLVFEFAEDRGIWLRNVRQEFTSELEDVDWSALGDLDRE